MSAKISSRALAVGIAGSLIAAACTGGGKPAPAPTRAAPATSERAPRTPICEGHCGGGTVVFGAEQWPECVNPVTACAASVWTYYTVLQHVLPRAMQLDPSGNFVPSLPLNDAPSLANGELAQNPFRVTFRIKPQAVWEDGSPITAADFAFTWKAILNTKGSLWTKGYERITSIDSSDPHTAVIAFDRVYADWPDLFGGAFGFILKRAAFPNADVDKPDLSEEMAKAIRFSGGPFLLQSWSPEQAVLVANLRYFGPYARFDRLTFVPRIDLNTEIQSINTGEVAAIYPQLSDGNPTRLLDAPPIGTTVADGTYFEALWFNNASPPLDDPFVREALMYAIDRQAVVDTIIKQLDPEAEVLNCGFVTLPNLGPWCHTTPFAEFTYDPVRAREILVSDGYDCSRELCRKQGRYLFVYYTVPSTVDGMSRREMTQGLLIAQARAAGIDLRAASYGSLTAGAPEISDLPVTAYPDPSIAASLACDEVPSPLNPFGTNRISWCNPAADQLMKEAEAELDPAKRLELFDQLYALEAKDFISLPLYVVPTLAMWRTDQIAGPIGDYASSPYGLFFNIDQWFAASA